MSITQHIHCVERIETQCKILGLASDDFPPPPGDPAKRRNHCYVRTITITTDVDAVTIELFSNHEHTLEIHDERQRTFGAFCEMLRFVTQKMR